MDVVKEAIVLLAMCRQVGGEAGLRGDRARGARGGEGGEEAMCMCRQAGVQGGEGGDREGVGRMVHGPTL